MSQKKRRVVRRPADQVRLTNRTVGHATQLTRGPVSAALLARDDLAG